ncbi:origin recognition complex subunit 1-like isoform X2 [Bolinopsis microptera]
MPQTKQKTSIKPAEADEPRKSSYFFLSSEDVKNDSRPTVTPKRKKMTAPPPPPQLKISSASSNTRKSTTSRRSTKLTSELETMSLNVSDKGTSTPKGSPVLQVNKALEQTPTPKTTRSGRKVKPVENFYSLQSSLAMEALMKSNLLKQVSEDTDSQDDNEVSFKENKPPVKKSKAKTTKVATTTSNKKKRASHRRCSIESTDSDDDDYEAKKIKRKKTPLNKNMRTPRANKNLKPAPLDTPCVIPLRAAGQSKETSFSIARSRLHVSAVPESLPCREEQFADIYYFLESKLEDQTGGCMYISGVPGTGKTATVRDVLKHINDGDYDYQTIEINGMKLSDPKQLYSLIYRHLEGKKVTPDHGNLLLSEYFGKCEKKSIVLVVDELDLLWTRKQHVMYNLFDWPNRANSKLVVIAIANTMDLPERMLMNKVASRLGLTRMTFQPYSHSQLLEIINSRLEGTVAFDPSACILAARKVAAASGDARRALDICRHSIEVAEQAESDTVTSTHIQRAITDMYQSVKTRAIMNCTLYQKIFLKSVLGVFRRKGVEEAVFKEVYEVFSSLCQFKVPSPHPVGPSYNSVSN